MFRKLAIALISIFTLLPQLANALGVGDIQLDSYLNQPLNAKIELLQTRDLTDQEILPGLASRADFQKAGVERFYFLTDLRFNVTLNPDGTGVITISSTKPVTEPFLNFLVEVYWPAGRLLREYTILLDPPVFSDDLPPVMAVAEKKSVRVTQPSQVQRQAPVQAPARTTRPSVQANSSGQVGSFDQVKSYKTTRNDSLWNVAKKLRPSREASVQQTMAALVRVNPHAFIDNNINLMKTGQVLRAPTLAQTRELTRRQAIDEVARQNRAWRAKLASRNKSKSGAAEAAQIDGTARGITSTSPSTNAEGNLKLVSAEAGEGLSEGNAVGDVGSNSGVNGGTSTVLQNEELEVFRLENQDLKGKVDELTSQAQTTEQLLTLKNDQIAALQVKMAELEALALKLQQQQESLAQSSDQGEKAEGGESTEMLAAGSAEGDKSGEEVDYNYSEEADEGTDQGGESTGDKETADSDVVEEAQDQKPLEVVAPEPSFMDQLLSNQLYIMAGILLLVVIGIMVMLSRKKEDDEDLEPYNEDFNSQDIAGDEVGAEATESQDQGDETDEVPTDEQTSGDVIGEADIYIAYGRFPQAVEMLEAAIVQFPERTDIRLKLLEVFVETGDTEQFRIQEEQLVALGDDSANVGAAELRASILGGELQVGDSAGSDETFDIDDEDSEQDFSFDSGEMETGDFPSLEDIESSLTAEPEGGFTLEDDSDTTDSVEADEEKEQVNETEGLEGLEDVEGLNEVEGLGEALEFDPEETVIQTPAEDIVEVSAEEEGLNFSLDDESIEEVETPDIAELDEALDDAFSLDDDAISDLDAETEAELDTATVDPEIEIVIEDDTPDESNEKISGDISDEDFDSDLDFSLDEGTELAEAREPDEVQPVSSDEELESSEEEELDFLADADETATKLDLARAYIDMGDRDGAKDILDEVILEGNGEQQDEAKELLGRVD